MRMLVLLAFLGAPLAGAGVSLEHCAEHLDILTGTANREPSRGVADVCAVETGADALPHVHLLGDAGIGARGAHDGAEHRVPRRRRECLIQIFADVRVKRDHLVNRHGLGFNTPPPAPIERTTPHWCPD